MTGLRKGRLTRLPLILLAISLPERFLGGEMKITLYLLDRRDIRYMMLHGLCGLSKDVRTGGWNKAKSLGNSVYVLILAAKAVR